MIILDTNVLSELMRPAPDPRVLSWVARQAVPDLFTTSICEAEILSGIEFLAPGKRKDTLMGAADRLFGEALIGRIFGFEGEAARTFSKIVAQRRRLGRPIGDADAQVAAIARVRGAMLATRNEQDFSDCGIQVVNPWSSE